MIKILLISLIFISCKKELPERVSPFQPLAPIHMVSADAQPGGVVLDDYVNTVNAGKLLFRNGRGHSSSPIQLLMLDAYSAIIGDGYDGTSFPKKQTP